MKKYIYIFITLLLLGTGCNMLKHEAERSIKKDVAEYFEDNFESHANVYHKKKTEIFRNGLDWYLKITLGLFSLVGGFFFVKDRIVKYKENKMNKEKSDYHDSMKNKNENS